MRAALLVVLVACTDDITATPVGASDGRSCTTSSDCGGEFECGYEVTKRCQAQGTCIKADRTSPCEEIAITKGRACGGGPVTTNGCNEGLPSTHLPRPVECLAEDPACNVAGP